MIRALDCPGQAAYAVLDAAIRAALSTSPATTGDNR